MRTRILLIGIFSLIGFYAQAVTWIHVKEDIWVYFDFHIYEEYFYDRDDGRSQSKVVDGPKLPFDRSKEQLVDVALKFVPKYHKKNILYYTVMGKTPFDDKWFKIIDLSAEGVAYLQDHKALEADILLGRSINYEVKQNIKGDWELWDPLTQRMIAPLSPTGAENYKKNRHEHVLTLFNVNEMHLR